VPAAAKSSPNGDQDSDGMSNATERTYHLDPCNPDSDGDGMVDGYEYRVALDLNNNGSSLPYPGTGPWPRPWTATDGSRDFDGDGLTIADEYRLWSFKGHRFPVTEYSDGLQASGGRLAVDAEHPATLDLNASGALTDDERDADGDGLSNVVELHFRGIQSWWKESDLGEEPDTCSRYVPIGVTAWRPFADSEAQALLGDALPFLNGPDPVGWAGDTWDGHHGNPQN
jgi:Bacterial TSP3 repeat